jgi:hypothetical protein
VKLLFVAGSIVNQAAHHQQNTPDNGPTTIRRPRNADALSADQILQRLAEAQLALDPDASVAWTAAYLRGGHDRAPLCRTLASVAAKIGNDPHNQEIGLCLVEDYGHSSAAEREKLLLAAAKHNAGHRKYGDPLEAYRRLASALRLETRETARGGGDPREALLDDRSASRRSASEARYRWLSGVRTASVTVDRAPREIVALAVRWMAPPQARLRFSPRLCARLPAQTVRLTVEYGLPKPLDNQKRSGQLPLGQARRFGREAVIGASPIAWWLRKGGWQRMRTSGREGGIDGFAEPSAGDLFPARDHHEIK